MKLGLVLEGGAMRGMYTAGVLDIFMQEGIAVDGIVGVSAGALFGVNYLSGQAGRVIRYNKRFNRDKHYMGLLPLMREGNIVSTQYAYYDVPERLDKFDDAAFQRADVPFYAVVTNMQNGEAEYRQIQSVLGQMETLRASGSMPFVSRPVLLDGGMYLDGGVADSIPFRWMAAQGYDKLIVVLTREAGYRKKPMNGFLCKLFYKRFPQFTQKLLSRHTAYNEAVRALEELEKAGGAFVLRPSEKLKIRRTEKNPDRLQAVYEKGVADARGSLAALRKYIEK